jgi:tetratricopeptide (TPR) repeat protein
MSLVDYRWNTEFELTSEESNMQLINGAFTNMPINYDLIPHETDIVEDLNLFSDMVSRFTPTVTNGATLTVEEGVNIDMYSSEIQINDGSSLVLEDNVTIAAKSGICKLLIDGNATFGSNINFIAEGTAQIWLEINNTALNLTMNSPVFENGIIIAHINQLTVNNPSFTGSGIHGYYGSFAINGGQFDDSFVGFSNGLSDTELVNINGSIFTGSIITAIDIDNYPNFRIDNCNISGHSYAISLYNCGNGTGFQQISNCDIHDNSTTGILLYRSSVDILHNHIINSGYGVKCFDRSFVHIEGDHRNVMQIIKDNKWNEIYASSGSFPQYLHWTLIQDDFNEPGDPMVKYTGMYAYFDVRHNCWGNTFDPMFDLEPYNYYNWNPVWNCNIGEGSVSSSDVEALYLAARENIETEEYAEAKQGLEQIVDEYPETEFAKAAMKELYAIEKYTSDNYTALKDYYKNNNAIQGDSSLIKLADFLANFCDIKLENWPTAIAWFEDVIQIPESLEDSIFAIIDMGYTYWLMENSGFKSSYTGAMPQYKFASHKDYEENRDYLLSLLPGDGLSETMKQSLATLKPGELLQNVPNPFNGTTQIWFRLDNEAQVLINIYDYTGKEVGSINPGTMDKGNHPVEFNSKNLPSGIYFFSLEVNGIVCDSKKMTVMK